MPKRKTSSKTVKAKVPKEDDNISDKEKDYTEIKMPKRKTSSKTVKAKVPKEDDNISDKEKDYTETKLEEFKKKLGMVQGDNLKADNWVNGEGFLIYNPIDFEASNKIAAFDIDGTLIETKSGKKFPKTWDDFKILFSEIPGKLKTLKTEGYKLVIFTNQGGFSSGYVKENDFKKRMSVLLENLGVIMQIFIASDKSYLYRKPNIGMFQLLESKYNKDIKIDLTESLYVGDAAGRPDNWAPGKKKDFSCSDRLFALNCGLKFYTPEEYFLNQKPAPFNLPTFNPAYACDSSTQMSITSEKLKTTFSSLSDVLPSDSSELVLIVMIGSPGSGKSHFCEQHLVPLGYSIVNRDTLKTWQKCVSETERLLKENKKVVIDNTNPNKASRDRYVECALKLGVTYILCFYIDVTIEHSRHNGKFRELIDTKHESISDTDYTSKYQPPSMDEKFTDICKIVPTLEFESDDKKSLYRRYLNDK